jgi:hypothetical protein
LPGCLFDGAVDVVNRAGVKPYVAPPPRPTPFMPSDTASTALRDIAHHILAAEKQPWWALL